MFWAAKLSSIVMDSAIGDSAVWCARSRCGVADTLLHKQNRFDGRHILTSVSRRAA